MGNSTYEKNYFSGGLPSDLVSLIYQYPDDYLDSYPENNHKMPAGSLDPHLELVEYLGDLNSAEFDSVMNIELTGTVGSEALMDYIAI